MKVRTARKPENNKRKNIRISAAELNKDIKHISMHIGSKTKSFPVDDLSSIGIGISTGMKTDIKLGDHFKIDINGYKDILCFCVHSGQGRIGGFFVNPYDQNLVGNLINSLHEQK